MTLSKSAFLPTGDSLGNRTFDLVSQQLEVAGFGDPLAGQRHDHDRVLIGCGVVGLKPGPRAVPHLPDHAELEEPAQELARSLY